MAFDSVEDERMNTADPGEEFSRAEEISPAQE
jgi:hypothetical protein